MHKFSHPLTSGMDSFTGLPTVALLVMAPDGQPTVVSDFSHPVEGVTSEDRTEIQVLQAALKKALDNALDASCLAIQEALGVQYGDFASMHYSGPMHTKELAQNFLTYLLAECEDIKNQETENEASPGAATD